MAHAFPPAAVAHALLLLSPWVLGEPSTIQEDDRPVDEPRRRRLTYTSIAWIITMLQARARE